MSCAAAGEIDTISSCFTHKNIRCCRKKAAHERSPSAAEEGRYYDSDEDDEYYEEEEEEERQREVEMARVRTKRNSRAQAARAV